MPVLKCLPILMCIADDTKWLFFRIVPPPSAGEQYITKLGLKCLSDNLFMSAIVMWRVRFHLFSMI